ncbi:hypothetical protein ACIU1J_19120 [Azospirillum doebereinerae]|uniref:hypothetical protein n=1 Tax=Azospirillum doebereinerae TaxID=92933 RepID=UPI00384DCEF1
MADSLQFHLYINNRSGKTLTFNRVNLDWGNFNNPENGAKPPVASIPPRTSLIAMIVTGAENSSSGTEGTVVYNVEGNGPDHFHVLERSVGCRHDELLHGLQQRRGRHRLDRRPDERHRAGAVHDRDLRLARRLIHGRESSSASSG